MGKTLKQIKAEREYQSEVARRAEAFRNGDFSLVANVRNTGAQYSSEQAIADHNNTSLRLTASTDDAGNLTWK